MRPPELSDGEVFLRPLAEGDVPAVVAACQDPEIPRWTNVPSPYTPEDARRFLAFAAADAQAGRGVAVAVTDAAGELLGTVGLQEIAGPRGEIGYWMARAARGRGVAVRAVELLRDWAVEELGLTEIEILPHRDNEPSRKVAERAGFTDTGRECSVARMPPDKRDGYRVYVWRA